MGIRSGHDVVAAFCVYHFTFQGILINCFWLTENMWEIGPLVEIEVWS